MPYFTLKTDLCRWWFSLFYADGRKKNQRSMKIANYREEKHNLDALL